MLNSVAASPASLFRVAFAPDPVRAGATDRQAPGLRDAAAATAGKDSAASLVAPGSGAEAGPEAGGREAGREAGQAGAIEREFSAEELRLIDQLRAIDRQVRTHELAHMAAGAGLTGGASFTYRVGPDNQRYAVGGEVSIDTSPGDTPEATIAKAEQIRAAALAPADPSSQDQKVAAMAAQMASVARLELAAQERVQRESAAPGQQGGGAGTRFLGRPNRGCRRSYRAFGGSPVSVGVAAAANRAVRRHRALSRSAR